MRYISKQEASEFVVSDKPTATAPPQPTPKFICDSKSVNLNHQPIFSLPLLPFSFCRRRTVYGHTLAAHEIPHNIKGTYFHLLQLFNFDSWKARFPFLQCFFFKDSSLFHFLSYISPFYSSCICLLMCSGLLSLPRAIFSRISAW